MLRFVRNVQPQLSRTMECMVFTRRDILGQQGHGALLTAPVIAGSKDEAIEALSIMEKCPVVGKAVRREINVVTELDELLQGGRTYSIRSVRAMPRTICGQTLQPNNCCQV